MEHAEAPRILMCPPDYYGIEYEINPWMNLQRGSDSARSRAAVGALYDTLIELGVSIELLEPVQGLPDLVFTANCRAGLSRTRSSARGFAMASGRARRRYFESWRASRGFEVVNLPRSIQLRGGRRCPVLRRDALIAGYRFRSDVRSHQWIGERSAVEVLPLELVDPRFYHLDTCFCPLAPDLAIYYPGAFDDYGRSVLERPHPESDRGRAPKRRSRSVATLWSSAGR